MVFVKTAEGVFTRRVIVPVATSDEWVSIAEGLNKGDQIVVDGGLFLERLIEEDRPTDPGKAQPAKPESKQGSAKPDNASGN